MEWRKGIISDVFCFSLIRLSPQWAYHMAFLEKAVLWLDIVIPADILLNYLLASSPILFPIHHNLLQSCYDNSMVLITKRLVKSKPIDSMKVLVTQWCQTLCDPMDCNSQDSFFHGILQARILEWVAIFFSNAWKWKWTPSFMPNS